MFNGNKKSLIILVFSCVLAVFLICLLLKSLTIKKASNDVFIINENVKVEEFIKDRYVLKDDNVINIGKNEKEIKNSYIDLSIKHYENEILLLFNKLYKEEKVNSIYVDEKYLLEVLKYINQAFNLNLEERNINELVIIIKDNYMDFRQNNKDTFENEYTFDTPYRFRFFTDNNMLNMSISYK